ncbi:serine hydrolase domain-containing protein [Erythrobacter sp. W53]|uniref:serine hydrolase domain-containing protein n=1 Tax=Erythrobacter sp. W53 TaxID=3425947 RepID=UPI003D768A76
MKHARSWKSGVLATFSGLSLAACASVSDTSSSGDATQLFAPLLFGDDPTTMEDMASATTLQVEKYRPQRILPGCGKDELHSAKPDAQMREALAQAQAYSDEQKGFGLIVLKDGAVIHQGFDSGVTRATHSVTASMMKSVLAIMVGIAIDRDLIASVDDAVAQYLPEWKDQPRGDVTLRQLLTMSSGLEPIGFRDLLFAPDANQVVLGSTLAEEPDSQFYYSNSTSQLLGAILDRRVQAAGYEGFAEFLHREFWCPLGNGEAILWTDETGMPRTYAGLHAGLVDWARIGEMIRNKGKLGDKQIVSAKWIEAMAQPSQTNSQYGLHIWRSGEWTAARRYNPDNPIAIPHSEPFAADDLIYFDGFGGQRVYIIPSKGLTIARAGQVNLEYDDAVVPNLLIRAIE